MSAPVKAPAADPPAAPVDEPMLPVDPVHVEKVYSMLAASE